LEEAFVIVPGLLGGAFRESGEIVGIGDGFFAAALGGFGEQRKIQALDWLAPLGGKFGADAAFVFQAGNFMTTGAAKVANPLLTFVLQLGIIKEGSIGIRGRILLFQGDE